VAERGKLIAIEGIDGSGKGTQAARLVAALQKRGRHVQLISFPRYRDTFFGARIGDFLNGRFGGLDEVHPFLAATLFAGDRLESRQLLEDGLARNDVVVLDRYVASNIAHQASKRVGAERQQLLEWIEKLEFEVNRLPKPDLVVLLDLPATEAQRLIARKAARSYTEKEADLQEADAVYLEEVRQVYLQLAARASGWSVISVVDESGIRMMDAITSDILGIVGPL
jgi:dTMP kinase